MVEDVVTVKLLAPVTNRIGGGWNCGEEVGFSPEIALDLIGRGVAEAVASPEPAAKAPAGPTLDKMVKAPPARKEDARQRPSR